MEPLDLEALTELPDEFDTLLGRIDSEESGLDTKASNTALEETNAEVALKAD